MDQLKQIFEFLWRDYIKMNPQAEKIHSLLEGRGERVLNDHVAFRTYQGPEVGLAQFEKIFVSLGYEPKGEYHFKEKKLFAKHYEHESGSQPKVFVSELLTKQLSKSAQSIIGRLTSEVASGFTSQPDFLWSGRPWSVRWEDYEILSKESEYAAWMAAFGFRANHFTVNVNELKSFDSLKALNDFLKENGFPLNSSGGEIKGGPANFLEQSSTLAARIEVEFEAGNKKEIPSCYYEFAKRYALASGELYQGFVEASADKIFESTDRARSS